MNDEEIRVFLQDKNYLNSLFPDNVVLDEWLAEGGQGIVYKGTVSGAPAAIKIYFPDQLVIRTDRETSALFSLDNPNIVKALWAESIKVKDIELPVIATTFISGTNLADRVQSGRLDLSEIGIIAYDIANAILAMWSSSGRIVHRDIKPPNVVIKIDGRACVIDLGVARHVSRTPLTTAGSTWGTAGYMSPEQLDGVRSLTSKSDIFALGVLLVECAMGRHPTRGDQGGIFTMQMHNKLPYELESWNYADVVKKMLHPLATKRPKPEEIMSLLQEFAPR